MTRAVVSLLVLSLLFTTQTGLAHAGVATLQDNCQTITTVIDQPDFTIIRTRTACSDGSVTICEEVITTSSHTMNCSPASFAKTGNWGITLRQNGL